MKKILLPLLCCLLATSCLKDDTFSMQGYRDFATVYQGKLVTDRAATLTVVKDESGSDIWKIEGARLFIRCDILNRNFDITLKNVLEASRPHPTPYVEKEDEPDDPVEILGQGIGGRYVNLLLSVYGSPASDALHPVTFHYTANTAGDEVTLYVLHDGNHENPAYMEEKKLQQTVLAFSIPLEDILKKGVRTQLSLCLYQLVKAQDGTYSVQKKTYSLKDTITLL